MIYTIHHNGFHGFSTVRVRGTAIVIDDMLWIPVSERVARRVNNVACGMDDCKCGERIAHTFDFRSWYVPVPETENRTIRGHYPQSV